MRYRLLGAFGAIFLALSVAADGGDDAGPVARPQLITSLSDQCDLVVAFGEESQCCWSHVCKLEKPLDLGCDLSAMRQVSDVSVSPDQQWLAVISVGEGHPLLEVVDLARLLGQHEYSALTTINPYPGTINLHGWREDALLVSSDVPLPEMPLAGGDVFERIGDSQQVFAVDLATWKVRSAGENPVTTE